MMLGNALPLLFCSVPSNAAALMPVGRLWMFWPGVLQLKYGPCVMVVWFEALSCWVMPLAASVWASVSMAVMVVTSPAAPVTFNVAHSLEGGCAANAVL